MLTSSNGAHISASVVIPCYNAEAWVAEAVDSCLKQTLSGIEIIVVDDGSTDGSRKILEQYGDRIQLVVQSNQGGCCARNVGFKQSRGEFIQFLDADDFLLPNKIERQRDCLLNSNAEVVYGDWRYQHHEPDQRIWLGEPVVSEEQEDVLCSLLRGWWVAPVATLYRRNVVEEVGGWDETLRAAQDRDFFTRVAMHSKRIVYQPGCDSIYRRYGNVTVSTSNKERFVRSHQKVLEKSELLLAANERLSDSYKRAIATSYLWLARCSNPVDPQLAQLCVQRSQLLDPTIPLEWSRSYNFLYRLGGFGLAERASNLKRWFMNFVERKRAGT
jgi:glycosyltransferase involved in cell wall biosynthesis